MNHQLVKTLSSPLYEARTWIKLLGAMTFIYGVLIGLSIAGLIIAWVPIWLGILLWQSAGALEQAYLSGDVERFTYAQKRIAKWFTITGILLLINLLIMVVAFAVLIFLPYNFNY